MRVLLILPESKNSILLVLYEIVHFVLICFVLYRPLQKN